jgi:DNA-binding HxlR family transcriptional regulator
METDFEQYCPVARALDLLGERWTMLIVRDLLLEGSRKFTDFAASMPSASPTTLSARLKILEEAGIVERRFYTRHPPRAEYLLTAKGLELRPVVRALKDWGQKHTRVRPDSGAPQGAPAKA